MMLTKLEGEFHDAMVSLYKRAKHEANYEARIFIGMVIDRGGLKTAQYLLDAPNISDGYTALWERKRLDLTVEAVILDEKWWPLFTPTQRKIAVERLHDYGYTGNVPPADSV